MYCSNCGSKINDNSNYCSSCGYKIENIQYEDSKQRINNKLIINNDTDKNVNYDKDDNNKVISETVIHYYKKFQNVTFLLHIVFILMIIGGQISDKIVAIMFSIYIILIFCFWIYMWQFAIIIGKRPFVWIIVSGIIPLIGPAYCYDVLKKHAISKGYIPNKFFIL